MIKVYGRVYASLLFIAVLFSSCGIYSFRDVSIPPNVKTIRISYIENRARYINPQLSPRLTDQFTQRVTNLTRLTRTTADDAHYQVSGYISNYTVSTASISGQQAATNRLTVGVHIVFTNTLENKTQEFDISRDFDFSSSLTLSQAEGRLTEDMVRNLAEEIFNRIFSNW